MIMSMLEKNKKTNETPLTANNSAESNFTNNYSPNKEITTSRNANNDVATDKGIDTIMKIKNIYDKINTGDDSRVNLLMALKPYLSDDRKMHIDTAIKLVNVSKISTFLSEIDVL
jgi:hypothetical protein